MTERDLGALRAEIDTLDQTLVETLEARFAAVRHIAAYKDARHLPVLDREREQKLSLIHISEPTRP